MCHNFYMKKYFWIFCGLLGSTQMVRGEGIVLTPAFCKQILDLVPGAAYVPGVDVDGNPVVPADLDAPSVLPDTIDIPISIASKKTQTTGTYTDLLSGAFDVNTLTKPLKNSDQFVSDQPIGHIRWNTRTGQMSWNGKALDGQWLTKVQGACRSLYPDVYKESAPGMNSIIVR